MGKRRGNDATVKGQRSVSGQPEKNVRGSSGELEVDKGRKTSADSAVADGFPQQ